MIVFDVDGTLFDTAPGIIRALNEVLAAYGRKLIADNEGAGYIGPPICDSLERFCGMEHETALEATALYRKLYVEKYVVSSVLYEGMREVLDALHARGERVGIATMKTMPQIDKLLAVFDMAGDFAVVKAAREDGSLSKTEMLSQIRTEFPDESRYMMVGDTAGDYRAAVNAGFAFVFATYGYGERPTDCMDCISSPKELLNDENN